MKRTALSQNAQVPSNRTIPPPGGWTGVSAIGQWYDHRMAVPSGGRPTPESPAAVRHRRPAWRGVSTEKEL
jgi:hypothetical protein